MVQSQRGEVPPRARSRSPSDDFSTGAVARHCVVTGCDVVTACGKLAKFIIEAHDKDGVRRTEGGDHFFVFIRGTARIRAKVVDHGDGSYSVEWRPSQSGTYYIAMSLFGTHLPGSPFIVPVVTPTPHAPNCLVRGEGLTMCEARASTSFEVSFRDKLGDVTQAMDLDVFVDLQHSLSRPSVQTPEEQQGSRRTWLAGAPKKPMPEGPFPSSSSAAHTPADSADFAGVGVARATGKGKPLYKPLLLPIRTTPESQSERAVRRHTNRSAKGGQSERPRARLDPARRQQYESLWSRRGINDHHPVYDINGVSVCRGGNDVRERSVYVHEWVAQTP